MMGPEPSVFVVVLNWNAPGDTIECLESLRHVTYRGQLQIVVELAKIRSPRATVPAMHALTGPYDLIAVLAAPRRQHRPRQRLHRRHRRPHPEAACP